MDENHLKIIDETTTRLREMIAKEIMALLPFFGDLNNKDLVVTERRLSYLHDHVGLVWKRLAMEIAERRADGRMDPEPKHPIEQMLAGAVALVEREPQPPKLQEDEPEPS